MILCKIDIEENSDCKLCCKECIHTDKCEIRCVFLQSDLECRNKVISKMEKTT